MKLYELFLGNGGFSFHWHLNRQPEGEFCLSAGDDDGDGIPIIHGDYADFRDLLDLLQMARAYMDDCRVEGDIHRAMREEGDDEFPF